MNLYWNYSLIAAPAVLRWTTPDPHLSDSDSTKAGRQEGSIIIAFAKSISWALVISISSVSRVINLQLGSWVHVTMWDGGEIWSQPMISPLKCRVCCSFLFFLTGLLGQRNRLLQAKASFLSSSHDVSLSLSLRLSPSLGARLTSPGTFRPRQAASWWSLTGTAAETTSQSDVSYQRHF